MRRALSIETGRGATFWYALAAIAMTWPLITGLGRDIPWDLGDSVLNCWILQWGTDHAMRFLGGDVGAFRGYFNANIFYPEPLTLAYSEHLTAQLIQVLPVYAVTGNIILCYNLLFLSTFVLSGLGAYLLVRDLTGSARAGFVAGLFYAFAPYRIGQFSHVQVLSSQWMPFALYLFRRYFETRRLRALAGAVVVLVAQNWSCGYFLLYFSPFAAAYVLYELVERGAWRQFRIWVELAGAAALVVALSVPLLLPYLALRAHGFGPRPFDEVMRYSADVYSYLTAHGAQRVWGAIARAFPKAEGDLFPSLTPVLLALVGLVAHAGRVWRASCIELRQQHDASWARWRRPIVLAAFVVLVSQLAAALIIVANGGFDWQVAGTVFRVHNLARSLRLAAMAGAVLLILSPRARNFARGIPRSAVVFSLVALIVAFLLSLGPIIFSKGVRIAGDGPYWWLYLNVPGYDGLRVPARLAMIVALFLAVLGGYGCAAVEAMLERASQRRTPLSAPRRAWWPGVAVLAIGVVFLAEATSAPIELNGTWKTSGLELPPAHLLTGDALPNVYRAIRSLPANAALVEFPFGDEQHDMRYMVASAEHWRPLVNGYSGGAPVSYSLNKSALSTVLAQPDRAWKVLSTTGATHAIVHEKIYMNGIGPRVSEWLLSHGARQIGWFGPDRLFELPHS
ncbi:MAG: hypothetical protein NT151_02545 [Acidobacteria bacterium]|nr:hypothetical protein [Acidobacteriota bacterium]